MDIFSNITREWLPGGLVDDKSILVQIGAVKPLAEPVLTKISDAILHHKVTKNLRTLGYVRYKTQNGLPWILNY